MTEAEAEVSDTDLRGIRRGRFTVSRLHRRGAWPARVLVIGSQIALGSKNRHEDAVALSERLADRLWLRSRRGVDLDVLWELRPVLRAVRGGLSAWRLWRYDAVVVIAPAHPSALPTRLRMFGVLRLLRSIIRELAAASHVIVVTLEQPEAWKRRAHWHATTAFAPGLTIRGKGSALVDALAIPDDPATGADIIANRLVEVLGDVAVSSRAARDAREPVDDPGRRRVVGTLAVSATLSERLHQVALMARNTFETPYAEIDIIGPDRHRTLAAAGPSLVGSADAFALGATAIESAGPTIIEDVTTTFGPASAPRVDGRMVRFYAAYPIESLEGYRIGVLCVFDTVPISSAEIDVHALRDLALLAEAELLHDGFAS